MPRSFWLVACFLVVRVLPAFRRERPTDDFLFPDFLAMLTPLSYANRAHKRAAMPEWMETKRCSIGLRLYLRKRIHPIGSQMKHDNKNCGLLRMLHMSKSTRRLIEPVRGRSRPFREPLSSQRRAQDLEFP